MDDMEEKLGAILGNPQMMQQIMAMAQSLGQSQPPPETEIPVQSPMAGLDMAMLSKIAGFASKAGVDRDQRQLLCALGPYLSRERIGKLEKAMKAAKLAKFASSALGQLGGTGG